MAILKERQREQIKYLQFTTFICANGCECAYSPFTAMMLPCGETDAQSWSWTLVCLEPLPRNTSAIWKRLQYVTISCFHEPKHMSLFCDDPLSHSWAKQKSSYLWKIHCTIPVWPLDGRTYTFIFHSLQANIYSTYPNWSWLGRFACSCSDQMSRICYRKISGNSWKTDNHKEVALRFTALLLLQQQLPNIKKQYSKNGIWGRYVLLCKFFASSFYFYHSLFYFWPPSQVCHCGSS